MILPDSFPVPINPILGPDNVKVGDILKVFYSLSGASWYCSEKRVTSVEQHTFHIEEILPPEETPRGHSMSYGPGVFCHTVDEAYRARWRYIRDERLHDLTPEHVRSFVEMGRDLGLFRDDEDLEIVE